MPGFNSNDAYAFAPKVGNVVIGDPRDRWLPVIGRGADIPAAIDAVLFLARGSVARDGFVQRITIGDDPTFAGAPPIAVLWWAPFPSRFFETTDLTMSSFQSVNANAVAPKVASLVQAFDRNGADPFSAVENAVAAFKATYGQQACVFDMFVGYDTNSGKFTCSVVGFVYPTDAMGSVPDRVQVWKMSPALNGIYERVASVDSGTSPLPLWKVPGSAPAVHEILFRGVAGWRIVDANGDAWDVATPAAIAWPWQNPIGQWIDPNTGLPAPLFVRPYPVVGFDSVDAYAAAPKVGGIVNAPGTGPGPNEAIEDALAQFNSLVTGPTGQVRFVNVLLNINTGAFDACVSGWAFPGDVYLPTQA